MTVEEDAPQNDKDKLSFRFHHCHSERPPVVIPNVVRNLRFPFDGWSIPTTTHRISSILDSSACAPQNDREGVRSSE